MKRLWGVGLGALFLGLLAAGGGAQYLEVSMSRAFWSGMATTTESATALGWSAVAMSAFAALFALCGGALSRMDRKGIGRFVVAIAIVFTAYNTWSVIGFQLKERLGRAIIEQQKHDNAAVANKAKVDSDTSVRDAQLAFLRAAFKDAKRAEDKDRLLNRMDVVAKQVVRDDTANLPTVTPDVQALVFASNPAMVKRVQVGSVMGLAILLAFGANIAFWLAGALLPQMVKDKPRAASAEPSAARGETAPTAPVAIKAQIAPAKVQVALAGVQAGTEAERPAANPVPFRRGKGKGAPAPAITDRHRAAVAEFFEVAGAAARPGARAKADLVHQWFCEWAKASGKTCVNQCSFGRIMGELLAERGRSSDRFNDGRYVIYRGFARPAFALDEAA